MDIEKYWDAVLRQDARRMAGFFAEGAYVNWHNTNEHFTPGEFIRANCEYPGDWDGAVQRVHRIDDLMITVVHVYSKDRSLSFHVTSFIRTENDRIIGIDEYWGDDGDAPQWRLDMQIGSRIK
ncbi:MAG: nuclear transport factor 2 family protein [Oscillospiraceae bacterium]|nr:nuclear transport factor 2 family protein [Oscillospiraceae bacterium]